MYLDIYNIVNIKELLNIEFISKKKKQKLPDDDDESDEFELDKDEFDLDEDEVEGDDDLESDEGVDFDGEY